MASPSQPRNTVRPAGRPVALVVELSSGERASRRLTHMPARTTNASANVSPCISQTTSAVCASRAGTSAASP